MQPQLASPSVGQRGWVAAISVERKPNQSHFYETKLLVMSDGSIHSDPNILVNVTVSEVESGSDSKLCVSLGYFVHCLTTFFKFSFKEPQFCKACRFLFEIY